jgi:hypothetical protein
MFLLSFLLQERFDLKQLLNGTYQSLDAISSVLDALLFSLCLPENRKKQMSIKDLSTFKQNYKQLEFRWLPLLQMHSLTSSAFYDTRGST